MARRLSEPIDKIDKFGTGNREAQFPKARDAAVALQHRRTKRVGEIDFHTRVQSAAERVALFAKQKREPGIVRQPLG